MDWWRCHPRAFSVEDCERIKDYAGTRPAVTGTVGYGGGKSAVRETIRRSIVRWLPREAEEMQWAYLRMERLAHESNRNAFGLDLSAQCGGFDEVQFSEYHGDSQQHYDWHEDCNWKGRTPFDRKLSMVLQISKPEDYEGGRLELQNDPLPDRLFRNQGDVIFSRLLIGIA